jgi:hypothetical protein
MPQHGEYAEAKETPLEGLSIAERVSVRAHSFVRTLAKGGLAVAWATLGNVAAQ